MRSEDKLEVSVRPMPEFGGKDWVLVRHRKTRFAFIPSFEDLFRIVRAICYCEDKKYPDGQGGEMVQNFLWDACQENADFDRLAEKYQIPRRP